MIIFACSLFFVRMNCSKYILFLLVVTLINLLAASCSKIRPGSKPLFTLLDAKHTGITFINQVDYTEEFNTYTYRNFYNGAGVGLGDFNRDGLLDIYFCGNLVDNKLYLNKGNFVFEDITEKAGVACKDVWSTGVSIADVNGDGWPDIYVCKSGIPGGPHRNNELFINNGDLTFTEKAAEYGLAEMGLSNHASFFDYDRDGDLDCYLLNNSFQSVTEFDITTGQREIRDTLGANKLYRNDGGHFVDVSREAGIYGSKIGFGLGVSVGDVNRDGWPDIYISNDFFERDYLYINNHDGTFTESLTDQLREISLGAMGADIADINNDCWPEIFVTEMTPEDNARRKTKALFENWERYQDKVSKGYYHQFARNVLQLNNRNGSFSEIGRYSGVSTTDWSWGALIMDMDNDGWKDIFVANGIFKDLLDLDYLNFYADPNAMRSLIKSDEKAILSIINMIPSVKVPNYAFHNNGDLTFTNLSESWGLGTPSFSNGAAYGDLDNDGDLDLVVNNVNMPSFVYRNESDQRAGNNFLSIGLKGEGNNTGAIGSEVILYSGAKKFYQEMQPIRGFKSTVDSRLHFGLGGTGSLDSLVVNWPDGRCTVVRNVAVNQFLTLDQREAGARCLPEPARPSQVIFSQVPAINGLDYRHRENDFNDFQRDGMLFQMLSNEGPHLAVADVNRDGREDLYICGAKDSPGTLLVQDGQGNFSRTNLALFEADKLSEDTDCAFFDADGDGDQDLYVTSGGNEFPLSSSALRDRLYINNGKGEFTKSKQMLPVARYESSSCVQPADFDNDGDIDLFVGIRLRPFAYGLPVNGYLLENNGKGDFTNVSDKKAPALKNIGMITDMVWADVENDGDLDMVIVGDWMAVRILVNDKGNFTDKSEQFGLSGTEGWWHVIVAKDLNGDGFMDFILGNHGLNSFFKALTDQPVRMYVNDFDLNGSVEQILCTYNHGVSYPLVMKDDLVKQIPPLGIKYKKFDDYKNQTMTDIFPADVLQRSVVLNARIMESGVLIRTGKEGYKFIPLPMEAQFTPVYAIAADDFDRDGRCDILLGGNQYRARPETGIYDAGYGLLLKGTTNLVWTNVPSQISGFFTTGEIRDLEIMKINGDRIMVVARNNDNLQFYKY
jgi:enediyne biosynthesis protein E4